MKLRTMFRVGLVLATIVVATIGVHALRTEAAAGGNHCGHGVKTCTASQVGQPCDPNNLSLICSAQANGSYRCLAHAPPALTSKNPGPLPFLSAAARGLNPNPT